MPDLTTAERPGALPGSRRDQSIVVVDSERLRRVRQERGLSQERLAYRAKISLTTVARLERQQFSACRPKTVARVQRSLTELQNGELALGPPKTNAGRRTVAFPALIVPVLRWHLACFAQPGDHGLLFTSTEGAPLRRSNFRRRVWLPAIKKAAVPAIHFHDLRHTGNTLTANAGANLREMMLRMGHASPRRDDLPALHRRSATRDRRCARRPGRQRAKTGHDRPARGRLKNAIGHATGTTPR